MTVRTVAAALAATFLLAGCGAELTTGVAARVGDTAIETTSFSGRVDRAFQDEFFASQAERPAFQQALLTRLVLSEIFDVAARRLGVTVTDADVDALLERRIAEKGGRDAYFRSLARENGISEKDVRWLLRYDLVWPRIEDALVEDVPLSEDQLRAAYRARLGTYDTARVAHIKLDNRARAESVAKLAKRPGADFGALAKRYSLDPRSKEVGGVIDGPVGNGQGRFEKQFERAIFTAEPGRVVGPVRTVSNDAAKVVGYEIFVVLERRTVTFEQAKPELRRVLLQQQIQDRFVEYIRTLAGELDVKVNPRFGRWDPERLVVVSGGGGLSSPAPIPGLEAPVPPAGPPAGPPQQQQQQPPQQQPTARPTATPAATATP